MKTSDGENPRLPPYKYHLLARIITLDDMHYNNLKYTQLFERGVCI